MKQLREVFERLRDDGLRGKCSLLHDEVTYLGHLISVRGIQLNSAKTRKVKSFPCPLMSLWYWVGIIYSTADLSKILQVSQLTCVL